MKNFYMNPPWKMAVSFIIAVALIAIISSCASDPKSLEVNMTELEIANWFVEKEKTKAAQAIADAAYYKAVEETNKAKANAAVTTIEGCTDCTIKIGADVKTIPIERITNEHDAAIAQSKTELGKTQARWQATTDITKAAIAPIVAGVVLVKAFDSAGDDISGQNQANQQNQQNQSNQQNQANVSTEAPVILPTPPPAIVPAPPATAVPATSIVLGDGAIYAEGGVDVTEFGDIADSAVGVGGPATLDLSQEGVGNVENQGNQQDQIDNTDNASCVINPITGACN